LSLETAVGSLGHEAALAAAPKPQNAESAQKLVAGPLETPVFRGLEAVKDRDRTTE